jgi:GR25 family glycosyltransferase involved in LPS biosynthesis
MQIKLTGIPAYYINLDGEEERGNKTKNLLDSLGFHSIRRVPGFNHENYVIGCAMAHLNALKSLSQKNEPFIIFEDDVEVTHFDHIIELPEDADSLYLGVSKMGIVNDFHHELLVVDHVEEYDHLYRIYNMLSGHAILYLNMKHVQNVINQIEFCLENQIPVDIGMAKQMPKSKVYALDKPMFIQAEKFRYFTDTPISKLPRVELKSK